MVKHLVKLLNLLINDVMSRNRFGQILWNLHVNDNDQIPKNDTDKLYKLRPLVKTLNESFFLKLYDSVLMKV